MFVLKYIIFVSVNSQNVTVQNSYITIISGENATLKWSLKKGDVFKKITSPEVYRGDRVDADTLLFDSAGRQTDYASELFKNRLSQGRFDGNSIRDKEVNYELNLTNVQYRDTGLFYFKVSFERSADINRVVKNATIALKVEGSCVIIYCDIFLDLALKMCE